MDILKIGLVAVIGVLLAVPLKSYKAEYGVYIGIAVCLALFGSAVGYFSDIVTQIGMLESYLQDNARYLTVLFKAVGATYACEFCAGICKDAGYGGIAGQVEMIGKLYILIIGMPILMALIESIKTMAG